MIMIKNQTFDEACEAFITDVSISEEEATPKSWAFIEHQAEVMKTLEDQLLTTQKRLCKHEGHLPISDSDNIDWCELCGERLTKG